MDSRLDPQYPDAKSKSSFQDGLEFQDFVCCKLAEYGIILQNLGSRRYQFAVGENIQGFEIKLDERCDQTGRLSIEVAEKSRNDPALPWTPSGIMRNDNSWLYIQGNRRALYVFPKNILVRHYINHKPETDDKFGTVRTFYIPVETARRWACRVISQDVPFVMPKTV